MPEAEVWLIDDEEQMLALLKQCLKHSPLHITEFDMPARAWDALLEGKPCDLILLDIMMPGEDGWTFLERLKTLEEPPAVIMLTALGDKEDVVRGLHSGADDYIIKPFEPSELTARVDAVLRRTSQRARPEGLSLSTKRHTASLHGNDLLLTQTEFELLRLLSGRPGQVFTRSQMLDHIDVPGHERYDRTIDTHIKNLREKLKTADPDTAWIETVWGIGYRWKEER
ncbi:response regulator transcription factor [Alkalicoccus urumqiensis]|uniref:DNA-binding response regulator n=1 Tax=Alkalicoccus urumqiensis TaxID=1548213 RepID=A0A2P6MIG7_ALKUR|nr:response regulator transcription factor [Alkalicoccus urumqiensis]PRO66058.1 DNA-binding response regulator [Alkalicoccus urumqiensis]